MVESNFTVGLFMLEKMKTMLSIIIIIICLPYLVTFIVQGDFLAQEPGGDENVESQAEEDTEQLIFILANEMPIGYEPEALKAQAVIARTNLNYAREHDLVEPEGADQENMREVLGTESYQKSYELLKNCVQQTAQEMIYYEDEIIQLPFHLVSAGHTRDASEWNSKKDDMPYLKAVDSSGDLKSERFLKVDFMSKKQFLNKLRSAYPDLEFPEDDVEQMAAVAKRDSSSYVLEVELPGKKVSGEEFRTALSLSSSCFSIKEVDDQVRIVTKGYGYGLGMSQFGANEMAKEGSDYRDILNYYYNGIKIRRGE